MEQKIEQVLKEIQSASHIDDVEKTAIITKIEEWREEKAAISDLTNKLEAWWLKVEPIFAEIGLI